MSPRETERDRAPERHGFGGWRDWLLVLVAGPIYVGGLIAAAVIGVGSRGRGPFSLAEALVAVGLALVLGLVIYPRVRGRRRSADVSKRQT